MHLNLEDNQKKIYISEYKLTKEIIGLSKSDNWDLTKLERKLDEVYETDEPGTYCVKKIIRLPSEKIFQAIKRARKDNTKSLNSAAIDHAYEKNG